MKFSDFLCFDAIVTNLESTDREGVIRELVGAIDKAGRLGKGNLNAVTEAVVKREKEASTGIGKGVAVPHVKHKAVKDVVAAIGKSSSGIDFSALDKQPVYSVILLISPVADPDKHLQAMEKIFKNLQQEKFRNWLRQAETVEQIAELFKDADGDLFSE